jgi:hypothetical protein
MGGRWGRVWGGSQGRGTVVPVTGLKGRSRHGAQKGLEGSVRGARLHGGGGDVAKFWRENEFGMGSLAAEIETVAIMWPGYLNGPLCRLIDFQ